MIIAALSGLPFDYDMIRTVILARDTPITLEEFRAQLVGAENSVEARMKSLVHSMVVMYVNGPTQGGVANSSSTSSSSQSS